MSEAARAAAPREPLPAGYQPLHAADAAVVVRTDAADAIRRALAWGTLERYAAAHPSRRALQGRGVVHAVPLPDGRRVVVRHVRHGGLLAPLTGDRFPLPTRAPRELRTAVRLAAAGVPTPTVVAYALHPAGPGLRRVDVVTDEITGGLDLLDALRAWPDRTAALLDATARLLGQLARAGARHPDLNVKNVLITLHAGAEAATGYVLDVDRVRFDVAPGGATLAPNLERLLRSARKLRAAGRLALRDAELERLRERAERAAA